MTYYYPAQVDQSPRPRSQASGALIVVDILAIIGIIVASVSLFLKGWVYAKVTFASRGPSGAQILQGFGLDIDKELSRISEGEIAKTVPPTMWQYKDHYFQFFFGLLVLMAVLLIVALAAPRARVVAHALALLAGAGAVAVMVVALLRVQDGMKSLPAQIGRAVLASPITKSVLGLTTGTPQLDSGPGVPLYAAGAGVALAVLCALVGLIVAAAGASRAR